MHAQRARSTGPNRDPRGHTTLRTLNVRTTTGITMEVGFDRPADAPVLAFVHGLDWSLHQFVAQPERFGDRYRVLLISLRGHGGTELERLYRQARRAALLRIPQHIARYDDTDTLRSARLPLLLIQGARDQGINDALASTLAALDAAHDTRVATLADAGHSANMEQPDRFGDILSGFLDDVEARRRPSEAGLGER